jgi:hypothetical protein
VAPGGRSLFYEKTDYVSFIACNFEINDLYYLALSDIWLNIRLEARPEGYFEIISVFEKNIVKYSRKGTKTIIDANESTF